MQYTIYICNHCGLETDDRKYNNVYKNNSGHTSAVIIRSVEYIIPAVIGGTDVTTPGHLCNECRQILKDKLLSFFGKAENDEQS